MSKVVDSGIKKFFIVFFGFILVLNVLSVLLFSHSLFYYLFSSIPVYESWAQDKFSSEYINIIKFSNISRVLVPIILVCFCLFVYFIKKKVKNNRRIIYPVMFLLLLFVIEYIVLSFFNYRFSFLKFGCSGWHAPEYICVGTYINFLYPLSLVCTIIFAFLYIIGYLLDNKEKNIKILKIIFRLICSFFIINLIQILVGLIMV